MNGFKVDFVSENGEKGVTWLGEPMTNLSDTFELDPEAVILTTFAYSRPGSKVVKITPCTLEEYQQSNK